MIERLKYALDFSCYCCKWSTFWQKVKIFICRLRGHPNGPTWYSSGFEPDMRCKDCGDEC